MRLIFVALLTLAAGCSVSLGRRFNTDPRAQIKVGFHQKEDVLRELGQPYRVSVDSRGREVFTYLWADGSGAGQKCLVAFNDNSVSYLVDCSP
jgi:hypothetical protein